MNDSSSRSVRDLLDQSTRELAPDVDRLVAGGLARGRVLRRRRRAGAVLATVAVVGVIGTVAGLGPSLLERGDAGGPGFADTGTPGPTIEPTSEPPAPSPEPQPRTPDRALAVTAEEIPAVVSDLVGPGDVGAILRDAPYGVGDEPQDKIVHFLWDGTLTSVGIHRADTLASCAELNASENQPDGSPDARCAVVDGLELLIGDVVTADGVTAQDVWAWNHGYIVSVISYNAADGKDVEPVTDVPPISEDELITLVTSELWFS